MAQHTALSLESRNAIVWLERQPGVTTVVKGRRTRTKHKHRTGFATVTGTTASIVTLRLYDTGMAIPLTVHAKASPARDKWVAQLAGGAVVDEVASRPRIVVAAKAPAPQPAPLVLPPAAVENAAQVYDVTPELATQWLEMNKRNRDIRQGAIEKYAADMRAGRWMLIGDAIQFDTGQNVINGQHRLWAVVESGVTVRMLVMFNCDPESINVMDDHLKRSLRDVVKVRHPGTTITNIHTSVANMLIQTSIAATMTDRVKARQRVSRQHQLEMIDRHWAAIEFVYRDCFKTRKIRGLTVTSVLTPMVRAYYTQDRAKLERFGKVLLSGLAEGDAEAAIILLRNLMLQQKEGALRAVSDVVYRKTERALHAFLNHEPIKILYEASEELFPLPEEQAK